MRRSHLPGSCRAVRVVDLASCLAFVECAWIPVEAQNFSATLKAHVTEVRSGDRQCREPFELEWPCGPPCLFKMLLELIKQLINSGGGSRVGAVPLPANVRALVATPLSPLSYTRCLMKATA